MTTKAGLTLLIIGTILLFVHVHIAFLSLQIVGLILVATAVLGWGLPRYRPGWTTRQRARLGEWLDPDPEVAGSARVPLTDILAAPAAGPAAAPVAAPQPPPADVTGQDLDPDRDAIGDQPAARDEDPGRGRFPEPAAAPGSAPPTWPAPDDPPTQPDIPAIREPAHGAGDDGPHRDYAGRHIAGPHTTSPNTPGRRAARPAARGRQPGAGLQT